MAVLPSQRCSYLCYYTTDFYEIRTFYHRLYYREGVIAPIYASNNFTPQKQEKKIIKRTFKNFYCDGSQIIIYTVCPPCPYPPPDFATVTVPSTTLKLLFILILQVNILYALCWLLFISHNRFDIIFVCWVFVICDLFSIMFYYFPTSLVLTCSPRMNLVA